MSDSAAVEALLARFVEEHVVHGRRLAVEELCRDAPHLVEPVRERVRRYEALDSELAETTTRPSVVSRTEGARAAERDATRPLPSFEGYRTIERLGSGGQGEVYKLEDLTLRRLVAGKIIRKDGAARASLETFLSEAKSLALFQDPRIVQVFEFRASSDPPLLLMELIDGFPLTDVAPSLEFPQRARIVAEVCEALHHAHELGVTHRDIKPANVLLDKRLQPKILDFGLASGDPTRGHGVGTLQYLAPEQLDPTKPIGARTDVYALGVLFYELLCGARPFSGQTQDELLESVLAGSVRLPAEVDPSVPEPLQAIALKAMERAPRDRYASAREMARDLRRFIEGRPVLARPTQYATALEQRVRPHLEHVDEWLRLKLVHPHEAERIGAAYRHLQGREDDWIVQSRSLSFSQITLYLGAFLVACGSLLYFGAERMFEARHGLVGPLLALALPFVALEVAARLLRAREHPGVAVAFHVAGVLLLPLFLLLAFTELGLWPMAAGSDGHLLAEASVSNRQLQVALLAACVWAAWLAQRTQTIALSSLFTLALFLLSLALLGGVGLRSWLEDFELDRVSLHLAPLVVLMALGGAWTERRGFAWLATPLHVGAAVLLVIVLELLTLQGKMFERLGFSLGVEPGTDRPDTQLDTLAAMALCGLVFHAVGWLLERKGSPLQRPASHLLFLIAPFALLEPVAYLNGTEEYSRGYLWLYLVLALGTTFVSHWRQRKAFYYAGLSNTGLALFLISSRYEWLDEPGWPIAILACGLAVLMAGYLASVREHERR